MMEGGGGGFCLFPGQQEGIPTIIKYSHPGTQLAVALSDHRLRVYQQDEDSQKWNLLDQWRGHDAEIFDIQWLDCVHGQFLASIGGDNKYKLWQEIPSHTRGRRFRAVFTQSSQDRVFYVAMDHLVRNLEVYVGLVSQTGLFSLLEPSEPDLVSSWREVDALYPFGQMQRSVEPCFSLSFQHAISITGSSKGEEEVDSSSIVFALSHRQYIKIFGSLNVEDEDGLVLQEFFSLSFNESIARSIAWANDTALPENLIAVLFDDGVIKLLDIKYEKPAAVTRNLSIESGPTRSHQSLQRVTASGISAGLAGLGRSSTGDGQENETGEVALKASSTEVAKLVDEHSDHMTGIAWIDTGAVLISMARNGVACMWKQNVDSAWMKYAESSFA